MKLTIRTYPFQIDENPAKRSLALRGFALGIEALERFIRKEPLRRVHKCVFGQILEVAI